MTVHRFILQCNLSKDSISGAVSVKEDIGSYKREQQKHHQYIDTSLSGIDTGNPLGLG